MIVKRLEAFWRKVDRQGPDECWPWRGARTVGGYGQLWTGRKAGETCLATHVSLLMAGKERPSAEHVAMHRCDNPTCVNPAHLSWGTTAENNGDRAWKSRARQAAGHSAEPKARTRSAVAKLNPDLVRYIRSSPLTTLALAAELRVTNQCISKVRRRETWRHVD